MRGLQVDRRRAIGVLAGLACGSVRAAEPTSVSLVVRGGRLVSGPNIVRLKRGDEVVLTVVSDTADELHVHGYDLHAALEPGRPATLRFVARRTGRFGMELHKAGADIGVFEIYPR